jgi:hypothetical protein
MSDDTEFRDTLRALPGQGWKALVFNYDVDRTARIERVVGWVEERDDDGTGSGYFRPLVLEWQDRGDALARPTHREVIQMWPDSQPDPSKEDQATMVAEFVEDWQAEIAANNQKAAKS